MSSESKRRQSEPTVYVLRITLRYTRPPIWRRVAVRSDITLGVLHEVVQIAMGWTDCHLHHFILRDDSLKPTDAEIRRAWAAGQWNHMLDTRMRGERCFTPTHSPFGDPLDMGGEDENAVTLEEVCPRAKSKLTYEYDFGDGWEHIIEVQKIEAPQDGVKYPVCLAGKRAAPPEDCGGVPGYYELLEMYANPKRGVYDHRLEWLGDDFDPDACDIEEINAQFAELP